MKLNFERKPNQSVREFLYLLPILVIYIVIVSLFHDTKLEADEGRYIFFAKNLLSGFYSPPLPDMTLWNGPGYPLFLAPFILLGASDFILVLLNAFLHFGSVFFLFLSLRKFHDFKISLFITLIWAFWFFAYTQMTQTMSESFMVFLVSLFAYILCSDLSKLFWKVIGGVTLGMMVLTKVIFFYVLVLLLILALISWYYSKKRSQLHLLVISAFAFLFITPYLIYTYQLTGKTFYLSNAGGMSLYWMSTPHDYEFGDWNSRFLDAYCWESNVICNQEYFERHHGDFMNNINELTPLERDAAFRKKAIENIKEHPMAFAKNILANFLRMYFNYPESYNFPRNSTLLRMIPGAFLLCFTIISLCICLLFIRRLPLPIRNIFIVVLLYMGGSSLLSSYPRMLHIIFPSLLMIITYTFTSLIKFKLAPLND